MYHYHLSNDGEAINAKVNMIRALQRLAQLVKMEVKHQCNQVLELGFPLGGVAKLFYSILGGRYYCGYACYLSSLGSFVFYCRYSKIIQNPSHLELQKAANQGQRCTWEKLSAIKANYGIKLALEEYVAILNHMRRLKLSAERAAAASHCTPHAT
ncbi:hypothetical protein Tco_0138130 [Tanacetum coccineum]